MENTEIIKGLQAIVGAERVVTNEAAVAEETKDAIGFRRYERADGVFDVPQALCAVKVKSTEEASQVLAFLNANKVKTTPRTGGSSVTQGIEPVEGAVMLDGSEITGIYKIDEVNMQVTTGCGMPLQALEDQLNAMGYTTGHSPQSLPLAQMGGLVATRSIGQWSTLYGGIENLLVGLEAVMADGQIIRIKNVPRRSTGPDLRNLFLGCEGTLGVFPRCNLTWSPCYHSADANKVRTDGTHTLFAPALQVTAHSTVGAGDAMVGGLLMGLTRGDAMEDCLRCGVAAAAASVMTEGTQLINVADFEALLPKVTLQAL